MAREKIKRFICAIGLCPLLMTLFACSNTNTRQAVVSAARDPWTWVPIAGAALVSSSGNDERISRWAMNKAPVYGSREAAASASDRFRSYASSSAWLTYLAAPPQHEGGWFMAKGMDAGGNLAGLAAARTATGLLKQSAQRERPNGSATHDSFPSAHSSDAFAHASLMRYYADDMRISAPFRESAKWLTNGFAMATAWGRVEGGYHYPSDVLMGAALANFTTHLFMKLNDDPRESDWRIHAGTTGSGDLLIMFQLPF